MPKSSEIKNLDTTTDRPSQVDLIIEGLKMKSRLSAKDKRRFAMNLGKLAARVDPDKPLRGAKQIIKRSKQKGIEEKRKRYFRFPNEDAPDTGRGGEYASNPATFVALAEAAGEELSNSPNQKIIDRHRKDAFKSLLRGSSFMPEFVPSNASDMDAKQVLEEYVAVLARAIEQRTKIQDLWQILDNTPIKLVPVNNDLEHEYVSPYGKVAAASSDFLKRPNWDPLSNNSYFFEAGEDDYYPSVDWFFPRLELGHIAWRSQIRFLHLPKEIANAFVNPQNFANEKKIAYFFNSVGTEYFTQEAYSDIDDYGWEEAWVSIFFNVGLQVSRGDNDQVIVNLDFTPSGYYSTPDLMYFNVSDTPSELKFMEERVIENDFKLHQAHQAYIQVPDNNGEIEEDPGDIPEILKISVVHSELFESDTESYPSVFGLLPGSWLDPSFGDEDDECFLNKNDIINFEQIYNSAGWTEVELIAKVLLGSNDVCFYPSRPQMDLTGKVFRNGSLAAGLYNNLSSASKENKISELLINKVALTANSGLQFYEAMLEEHRAVISRI
jgi:hypothetical protein